MQKTKYILALLLILTLIPIQKANALVSESIDPRGTTKDAMGKIIPLGYCINILQQGAQGPQVEDLQNILKSDPTIYPEGLTTGYYGSLTKEAVKRLQKKFNLSQTGEVDEETSKIVLPCPIDVQITVVSPNGGETWNKKDIHEITWKLSRPVAEPTDNQTPTQEETVLPIDDIDKKYFWPQGRIDLIKSDGTFVKHITTINLAYQSYTWEIDSSIANGADYKIRIELGPVIACKGELCPLLYNPKFTFGDESNNPFSITGETNVPPKGLDEAIAVVEEMLVQMQKLLALLKSMKTP